MHIESLLQRLIGVSDAAKRLEVCEGMVRYWADQGRLACMRVRRARMFHPDDVEAFRVSRQVDKLLSGHRKRGPKVTRVRENLKVVASSYTEAIA